MARQNQNKSKKSLNRNTEKERLSIPYIVLNIHEIFNLVGSLDNCKKIDLISYKITPNKYNAPNLEIEYEDNIWCGLFLISNTKLAQGGVWNVHRSCHSRS